MTAKQLGWEYDEAGFPYTIETKPEGEGKWFYLKGINPLYKYMVIGVGTEQIQEKERHYRASRLARRRHAWRQKQRQRILQISWQTTES